MPVNSVRSQGLRRKSLAVSHKGQNTVPPWKSIGKVFGNCSFLLWIPWMLPFSLSWEHHVSTTSILCCSLSEHRLIAYWCIYMYVCVCVNVNIYSIYLVYYQEKERQAYSFYEELQNLCVWNHNRAIVLEAAFKLVARVWCEVGPGLSSVSHQNLLIKLMYLVFLMLYAGYHLWLHLKEGLAII